MPEPEVEVKDFRALLDQILLEEIVEMAKVPLESVKTYKELKVGLREDAPPGHLD